MQFDRLAQQLTEMALAGVHRATRDFGLTDRQSNSKHEQQSISIYKHAKIEDKLNAEFDPHNVLPPVHVVLQDVAHHLKPSNSGSAGRIVDVNLMKRAKSLSTPDNIVLIASPAIAGGPNNTPAGVFAIVHNWAHTIPEKTTEQVIRITLRAILEWYDDKESEFYENVKYLMSDDAASHGVTDYPIHDEHYDEFLSKVFAIPSEFWDEMVHNMFYQYVKFGKITLRLSNRTNMLPYTQSIQNIFDNWVNSQKGKVVYTRIQQV